MEQGRGSFHSFVNISFPLFSGAFLHHPTTVRLDADVEVFILRVGSDLIIDLRRFQAVGRVLVQCSGLFQWNSSDQASDPVPGGDLD